MSNEKLAAALRALANRYTLANPPDHEGVEMRAAREALAEYDAKPRGFTVCIQELFNTGTTHVTFQEAETEAEAIELAKVECLADWDDETEAEDLHVFAVMRGNFDILQWDDQE